MAGKQKPKRHPKAKAEWEIVVGVVVDVLRGVPSEADRDVALPGVARVVFGGRSMVVPEASIDRVVADLRAVAVEELGEAAAAKLEEPRVERRGLQIPNRGLARSHISKSVRAALEELRLDLSVAGTRARRTRTGVEVIREKDLAPGSRLLGTEQRRYLDCLDAIDALLVMPRLTDDAIKNALLSLRRALGRKAGPEGKGSGLTPAQREALAIQHKAKDPSATREELMRVSGMSLAAQSRSRMLTTLAKQQRKLRGGATRTGILNEGQIDAVDTQKACPFCGASYDPGEEPASCSKCNTALP